MTWQIGRQIVHGELTNWKQGLIRGWIELRDSRVIRVELSGDLEGQLKHTQIRFRPRQVENTIQPLGQERPDATIAARQTGEAGQMAYCIASAARRPPDTDSPLNPRRLTKRDSQPCLYLEWWSVQNGRVVAEVVKPLVECLRLDGSVAVGIEPRPDSIWDAVAKPSWNGALLELDAQTKRRSPACDESQHDGPIASLLDGLPDPDDVHDEPAAERPVEELLDRLAGLNVEVLICDHYSDREIYRLLVRDLLPQASVHPDLQRLSIVQHYDTRNHCLECQTEDDRID